MSDTWIDIGGIDEIPQKGSRVVKTSLAMLRCFAQRMMKCLRSA